MYVHFWNRDIFDVVLTILAQFAINVLGHDQKRKFFYANIKWYQNNQNKICIYEYVCLCICYQHKNVHEDRTKESNPPPPLKK